LPGGHLIALDMQPLFHDAAYQKQYSEPILPIFNTYQKELPWGGDFPDEAKPFFSPAFLWTRPKETEAVQTTVFEAFKDYLQAYLDLVEQAQPVTDSQRLGEILEAQLRYINYRAAKDPARGMFTRFYGEEWTEEYIHGFLFDLERHLLEVPTISVNLSYLRAKTLSVLLRVKVFQVPNSLGSRLQSMAFISWVSPCARVKSAPAILFNCSNLPRLSQPLVNPFLVIGLQLR